MTVILQRLVALRHFSITVWFHTLVDKAVARVIDWAFAKRTVQHAFVKRIGCNTPIGSALNSHIEDQVDNSGREGIDADDIRDLDGAIESSIEDYLRNNAIKANEIEGLDDEVSELLEDKLDDIEINATNVAGLSSAIIAEVGELIDDAQEPLVRLIAQRMSY